MRCMAKWDPTNKEKYIGEPEVWEETEGHIRQMLNELNIPFTEDVGEAAFYGPKVDINAKNVYGKEDTMITIQWDALLAEQFDMYYIDENGDKQRPYIIHRTSMGCRNVPDMALPGAGSCDPDLREVQRLCAEGRGPDERGRHPLLRRRTF